MGHSAGRRYQVLLFLGRRYGKMLLSLRYVTETTSRTAARSPREARGLSGRLNVLVTGSSEACRQSIITNKLMAASSMLYSGGITRV